MECNVICYFKISYSNPYLLIPLVLIILLAYIFNKKKLVSERTKQSIIRNIKATSDNNQAIHKVKLNPENIPSNLLDLKEIAEKWGLQDESERKLLIENSSEYEINQLKVALWEREEEIESWIGSFSDGVLTDEAIAYMYMLVAVEELTVDCPS